MLAAMMPNLRIFAMSPLAAAHILAVLRLLAQCDAARNVEEMVRHPAVYVDMILKGAKPSDLPVQQPTRFELYINLKNAQAWNLTIPESFLLRADKVID